MVVGVLLALCAAVCMGTATVLQALGARSAAADAGVRPGQSGAGQSGVVVAAMRSRPFLAGAGLDVLGFAAEVAALRAVPLFLVEAAVASSLAVTAVVAAGVLRIRLRRAEWGAVAAVCLGLAALAVAAGHEGTGDGDGPLRVAVLGASLGLALLGSVVGGRVHGGRAVALGGLAGLSFGLASVGVRLLPDLDPVALLGAPTSYAVVVSGISGYVMLVQALQGGSVTAATAAMVIGETVWPGVFGVVWLGDTTRHGFAPLAVAGFVVCVAGAVVLARFGEVEAERGP